MAWLHSPSFPAQPSLLTASPCRKHQLPKPAPGLWRGSLIPKPSHHLETPGTPCWQEVQSSLKPH